MAVTIITALLLWSCKNSTKEINDFLADRNLPIGVAENVNFVYKDSGRVTRRMMAPVFWDFSNRELNTYSEFPEGVKIVSINRVTRDSVTITGNYAISYDKTAFSEIVGDVVVINHTNGAVLNSEQIYCDDKEGVYFTETPFTLYTQKDTLKGVGFESDNYLSNWILNNTSGDITLEENIEN
ncbi:LPS export ABC transporter periplasmic protein LptC [Ochrovirga pacifica]|uniref:LPS export ABC transporter periplasmic protein LptC n=1 Tax=Ochrovirga pacifica TaxID=1042376 RepID=UPI000496AF57|nr:LPS export ABC transporter periplasmic protein LptC [Ochrovirga pacifica]